MSAVRPLANIIAILRLVLLYGWSGCLIRGVKGDRFGGVEFDETGCESDALKECVKYCWSFYSREREKRLGITSVLSMVDS